MAILRSYFRAVLVLSSVRVARCCESVRALQFRRLEFLPTEMPMRTIRWGIIGCGDVTEVKSGPGFQKANNSSLVAVMRRNGALAKDYAERHGVPRWYDNAEALINDSEVDA